MTVVDDLQNGLDPSERVAAVDEWDKLKRVLANGQPFSFASPPTGKMIIAVSETLLVEQVAHQVPSVSELLLPSNATSYTAHAA